eukprot:scaffold4625_cov27-Phaeocystis_antarctica.AAC.1
MHLGLIRIDPRLERSQHGRGARTQAAALPVGRAALTPRRVYRGRGMPPGGSARGARCTALGVSRADGG